jgi:hypothetical protein
MPRILPTFAAIAVIGVCIAFNTARYPIVWEMVGPNAQLSLSEKNAPAADVASSAQAESLASTTQNTPQTPNSTPKADPPSLAKKSKKHAVSKMIPISLPKEELVAADAKRDADKAEKAESNGTPAVEDNLVEPPKRLVPVANDALAATQGTFVGEIRRLPPVEAEAAYPAGVYAGEYPYSAMPIYPSTGR